MNGNADDEMDIEETDLDEYESQRAELLNETPIPLLWLIGKTGSGKTSLIRFLTGATRAEIGNGFKPQTRYSQLFDFPDEEVPIARFLDTRGLGETGYDADDAEEHLREFDEQAHLLIVTVRATDQATDELIAPLKKIRKANPTRPVLLVISALHDGYPGKQHPDPNPFDSLSEQAWLGQRLAPAERAKLSGDLPDDLLRSLEAKLKTFAGLFDRWTVADLTPVDEGFEVPEFGGERLKQSILEMLPDAYRQALVRIDQLNNSLVKAHHKRCAPVILAHSLLAASAAAVPLPWVDIPVVLAIQSRLAYKLAGLNNQKLDAATLSQVSASLGGRVAMQMGIRAALKIVPWVGMAANSAATFVFTFASGWVWNWYFVEVGKGHMPTADELREVYAEQLKRGEAFWKTSSDQG